MDLDEETAELLSGDPGWFARLGPLRADGRSLRHERHGPKQAVAVKPKLKCRNKLVLIALLAHHQEALRVARRDRKRAYQRSRKRPALTAAQKEIKRERERQMRPLRLRRMDVKQALP